MRRQTSALSKTASCTATGDYSSERNLRPQAAWWTCQGHVPINRQGSGEQTALNDHWYDNNDTDVRNHNDMNLSIAWNAIAYSWTYWDLWGSRQGLWVNRRDWWGSNLHT